MGRKKEIPEDIRPFCPKCNSKNGTANRSDTPRETERWQCYDCKATFNYSHQTQKYKWYSDTFDSVDEYRKARIDAEKDKISEIVKKYVDELKKVLDKINEYSAVQGKTYTMNEFFK